MFFNSQNDSKYLKCYTVQNKQKYFLMHENFQMKLKNDEYVLYC